MIISEMPEGERPRERLLLHGACNLSNGELLAIILRSGTRNRSSKDVSLEILKLIDETNNLQDLSINKLMGVRGIGKVKAIEIVSIIELGRRLYSRSNKKTKSKRLLTSFDVYEDVKDKFIGKKQEYFYTLYFNNKQELIERRLLFMGTINRSVVHPREIFKYAYLLSATSIICVHNHPSGDVTPSKEDIIFTKSLYEIGQVQGIPVIDHIIVGSDNYYSFKDNEKIINM
jgi:DNA repair protein radc